MFSTIKNYIGIALVVTIAILTYQNRALSNDKEDLIVRLGVEQIARISSEKRLEESLLEQKDYYNKYATLSGVNKDLSIELNTKTKLLDSYKRREQIAIKKPILVERLANRATIKLFNDYACATGDSKACPDSKD